MGKNESGSLFGPLLFCTLGPLFRGRVVSPFSFCFLPPLRSRVLLVLSSVVLCDLSEEVCHLG